MKKEMNKQKKLRRGFTLVELAIAMGLLAIVSVVIVTFSSMTSKQADMNNTRSQFLDSVVNLKNDLTKDFSQIDEREATFTIELNEEKTELTLKKEGSEPITINLTNYKSIDKIEFEIIEGTSLLKIILTNNTLECTQTFTIMSKTGGKWKQEP